MNSELMLKRIRSIKLQWSVGTQEIHQVLKLHLAYKELAKTIETETGMVVSIPWLSELINRLERFLRSRIQQSAIRLTKEDPSRYETFGNVAIWRTTRGAPEHNFLPFEARALTNGNSFEEGYYFWEPDYEGLVKNLLSFSEFSKEGEVRPPKDEFDPAFIEHISNALDQVTYRLHGPNSAPARPQWFSWFSFEEFEEFLTSLPSAKSKDKEEPRADRLLQLDDKFDPYASKHASREKEYHSTLELVKSLEEGFGEKAERTRLQNICAFFYSNVDGNIPSWEISRIYNSRSIFSRAKSEMKLGRLETERQIAISTCLEAGVRTGLTLDKIEEIKESLRAKLRSNQRFADFLDDLKNEDLPDGEKIRVDRKAPRLCYVSYQLKCISSSTPFLMIHFNKK